jgi:hypothetical protein
LSLRTLCCSLRPDAVREGEFLDQGEGTTDGDHPLLTVGIERDKNMKAQYDVEINRLANLRMMFASLGCPICHVNSRYMQQHAL